MDGHPDVHAKTIRESCHRHHQLIVNRYFQEVQVAGAEAEPEREPRRVSPQLKSRIEAYRSLVSGARAVDAGEPRSHAVPRVPRAGGRAAACHLRRPFRPVRPGRAADRRPAAGRAQPRRQSRAGCRACSTSTACCAASAPSASTSRRSTCASTRWCIARSSAARSAIPTGSGGPALERAERLGRALAADESPFEELTPAGKRALWVFEAMEFCRKRFGEPRRGHLRREHGAGHRRRAVGAAARTLGGNGRGPGRAGAARRRAAVRVRRGPRGGRRHHRPPAGRSGVPGAPGRPRQPAGRDARLLRQQQVGGHRRVALAAAPGAGSDGRGVRRSRRAAGGLPRPGRLDRPRQQPDGRSRAQPCRRAPCAACSARPCRARRSTSATDCGRLRCAASSRRSAP